MNIENEIIEPKQQLNLYGYEVYLKAFFNLYCANKLPNILLLSGNKGIGKATFAYHFINSILSKNEDHKYDFDKQKINSSNLSYNLIQNGSHPNFFLLDNSNVDENIKIQQVRNLLSFLSKTTYSQSLKIILIDNVDFLNLNSANALLKSLEEPPNNTYFFVIYNNMSNILRTIKSRCIEYKFHFNFDIKKKIFTDIIHNYEFNYSLKDYENFLFFDTPGNVLRYLIELNDSDLNLSNDTISCINNFMEKFKKNKNSYLLSYIQIFIENLYCKLYRDDTKNLNKHFINKSKILSLINDTRKFNLDTKNLFISLNNLIKQ